MIGFESDATNMVTGQTDANNETDVFRHVVSTSANTLLSHAAGSATTTGNAESVNPVVSPDGLLVAFASLSTNLIPGQVDTNGARDLFIGAATGATTLVSHAAGSLVTTANGVSEDPWWSDNGKILAYEGDGTNLVAGQVGAIEEDIFLYIRDDVAPTITITTPPNGATYTLNQVVNATYACADEVGGSGLATCAGPVANGAPIDTATAGPKTFTVNATDKAGNPATLTHNYTVTPPTVTVNQAGGQLDPTNTTPINFTAAFSAPVAAFTATDVSFVGSTAPGTLSAVVTGGPATYNVAVSGMTGAGTVVVSIPANVTTGGNAASTSTDNSVTFKAGDFTAPTCKITAVRRAPNTASGRDEMDVTVQDTPAGLLAITNIAASNAVISVTPSTPFALGTTQGGRHRHQVGAGLAHHLGLRRDRPGRQRAALHLSGARHSGGSANRPASRWKSSAPSKPL